MSNTPYGDAVADYLAALDDDDDEPDIDPARWATGAPDLDGWAVDDDPLGSARVVGYLLLAAALTVAAALTALVLLT